jgi:hypothetical protein
MAKITLERFLLENLLENALTSRARESELTYVWQNGGQFRPLRYTIRFR